MAKNIAYVMGTFPLLTTTFVNREILELQRQGHALVLLAIQRPSPFDMRPEIQALRDNTTYLLAFPWYKFVGANLYFACTRPRVYLAILFSLIMGPHDTLARRFRTLLHVTIGVLAASILKTQRVAHIHAHFADRNAIVALVAAKLLGVSYSLSAHAKDIYQSPVLLPEKIAQAKFITTCTSYNKAYLERLTGRPIDLMYHGLDPTEMQTRPRTPEEGQPPLILAVGQLNEKKGFAYLISACQRLKSQGYTFQCEIIGDGPLRQELQGRIAALNLQQSLRLRGALPHAQVMDRYAQATTVVLPCIVSANADRDGIPNVLLEAMAHRVPIISTRLSGIPEAIEHGVTGWLVPAGDAEALAKAIARLLDDAALRHKLGQQGYHHVETHFNIRHNIRTLVRRFEQGLQKP